MQNSFDQAACPRLFKLESLLAEKTRIKRTASLLKKHQSSVGVKKASAFRAFRTQRTLKLKISVIMDEKGARKSKFFKIILNFHRSKLLPTQKEGLKS